MIQIMIWVLAIALSIIPGVLLGSLSEALFGPWAYWIGYVIGTIAFFIAMSPILFLDKKIPVPEGGRSSRSVMPFLMGMWAGSKMNDE